MPRIVITGTSSGLGYSLAKALVESGRSVVGIQREPATDLNMDVIECDLSDMQQVATLVGRLDSMCSDTFDFFSNAASASMSPCRGTQLPTHVHVNALSPYYIVRELARCGNLSSIVTISSIKTDISKPLDLETRLRRGVGYFTSKQLGVGFLQRLAKNRQLDYLDFFPGPLKTKLVRSVIREALPKFPVWSVELLASVNSIGSRDTSAVANRLVRKYMGARDQASKPGGISNDMIEAWARQYMKMFPDWH